MKKARLETSCIFRSAFHVCCGADLCGIRMSEDGRRIATFQLTGDDIEAQDKAYRSGNALVNPLQLRESLNHVRDRLFMSLKKRDKGRRENEIRRGSRSTATDRSNYQSPHYRR